MYVHGVGSIFAGGRGYDVFRQAVERHESSFVTMLDLPFYERPFPVYRVPDEALMDQAHARKLRRADRFSRMAVLGASDALADAGGSGGGGTTTGIIIATALGPHRTTFRFLDDMREYGDAQVSPTIFSHTVHNAAASYVAGSLALTGPVSTVTDFFFSFQQALLLGQLWLNEQRCERVLVGAVDELGTIMEYVCSRKLRLAGNGKIDPFSFSAESAAVPGEGGLFMLLSHVAAGARAEIRSIEFGKANPPTLRTAGYAVEADGLIGDETIYGQALVGRPIIAGHAPVFGSIMSGSGFHCAAAMQSMNESVQTLRYDCDGRWSVIEVQRM
jgi:3-oxoacyl-[acyl-carrier-protein] synthase II